MSSLTSTKLDASTLASLNRTSLLELTVVGRKTGTPRTVTIWFVATQDKIYVSSGRGSDSHWVKNLKQTPTVTCRIGSTCLPGVAVWVEGERVRETVFSSLLSQILPCPYFSLDRLVSRGLRL